MSLSPLVAALVAGHALARVRDMSRPSAVPRAAVVGLVATLALMALAVAVPEVLDWWVHVNSWPPLHAEWDPRVGPGTVPAVLLALWGGWTLVPLASRLSWRTLLVLSFTAGLTWMLALALVDGWDGIGVILGTRYEYLPTARGVTDFGATLHEYVGRISYDAYPRNWPVHVAGHPPGALLFFVVLVRLGLGGGLAAGLVVTVLAATTAPAVLQTLKVLGAERVARAAAPFLVLGPAAVWQAVSGDALFGAVGAWGILVLAVAATRPTTGARLAWGVGAGLLLGYGVMMSYGLPLLGILALAVLWLARSWLPLPAAVVGALAVVGAFAIGGFHYWDALPELHDRYWEGVAGRRPESYWIWGNLAAFAFAAGPAVGAGLAQLVARRGERPRWRDDTPAPDTVAAPRSAEQVAWTLATAGFLMVLVADASQMSRAEVERIWLPFVPWCLVACALLPERWRRPALAVQLVAALLVQHLLSTGW